MEKKSRYNKTAIRDMMKDASYKTFKEELEESVELSKFFVGDWDAEWDEEVPTRPVLDSVNPLVNWLER